MEKTEKNILNVVPLDEVAEALGYGNHQSFMRMVRRKHIPHIALAPNRILFDRRDIEKFLVRSKRIYTL